MERLISVETLAGRLDDSSGDLLPVQVTTPEVYEAGHLPGAVLVVPGELVAGVPPATGRIAPLERLTETFVRLGLTDRTTVVVYDDEGGGWAGRLAWTLDVLGHDSWLYLDGGLAAWVDAGLSLDRRATPRQSAPQSLEINSRHIAEADDVLATLNSAAEETVIWDCRSREEYLGQRVVAARGGHIPGAVNLDWLDLMDRNRGLRLVDDLEQRLAAAGITAEKDIITHCQTHHRSGLTYMVARLLGFPRIRAYHGSWSEWGNRDDTPIEV